MNTTISKIISVVTATVMLWVTTSGNIKSITDEVKVYAAESEMTGDVSNNGRIDILDLVRLKKAELTSDLIDTSNMDLTGDGIVDYKDTRSLKQYLLNQNDSFPTDIIRSISDFDTDIVSKDQPIETSVTAEMAKKADELGDAVSVYNYLYNNMRSEFYFGSRKGAIGAYEQGGGNDIDLSSLLIAMLRYLGYEADYASSKAGFTGDQIKKWTNTDSVEIAHTILSSQHRNNVITNIDGIDYYFYDYKYVQLVSEGKTYYLDICFKEYESQECIYDDIYNALQTDVNLKKYDISEFNTEIYNVDDNTLNIPEQSYYYSKKIITKNISFFSEDNPHPLDYDIEISKDISDAYSDQVIISIGHNDQEYSEPLYYRSADLYKKDITITYKVSDLSKENAMYLTTDDSMDTSTIFNLPSSLYMQAFSVTPELIIDGDVIPLSSNCSLDLNIGDEQLLMVALKTGGEISFFEEKLTAGEMCSVVLDMGQISSNELSESYIESLENTRLINNKYQLTELCADENGNDRLSENNIYTAEYFGALLKLTGLMYFSQVDITSHSLAEKENVYSESLLRMSFVGYKPTVWNKTSPYEMVNQEDGILRTGKFYIDAQANNIANFSLIDDSCSLQSFNLERGLISSELESTVLQQVFNVEALSTATIFNHANENSIPIVTLSDSSEHKISEIVADSDDIQKIQEAIDDGCIVITPVSKVKIGTWSGLGYIVIKGTSQKFLISGGYFGGTTIDPVPFYYTLGVALDLALIAEGVSLMIGALAAMSTLALGPVAVMVFMAVSVTFIAIDILKQTYSLYEYEFEGNAEAGYEIWMSTLTNSGLTLITAGGSIVGKRLGSVIIKSRLARMYGKSVINSVENSGVSVNEINSAIKKFISIGIDETTIDTLLKNSKSMYLGDDILNVIGKSGGNQKLLAELVLKNGDDFSSAIVKTNVIDSFFELVNKYGDDAVNVLVNGDEAISFIGKYDDASGIIKCFKNGNVKGIDKLLKSEVSNVYTFSTSCSGKTYAAGSCNYNYNPTITVPDNYFDDIDEFTGKDISEYYFRKYNNLLNKDYIESLNVDSSIKKELLNLCDAVQFTKDEAAKELKEYIHGNIHEWSFTKGHSVTNCGEIWSAREAILDGAKFDELSFWSFYSKDAEYLPMCDNCQHTFIEYLEKLR